MIIELIGLAFERFAFSRAYDRAASSRSDVFPHQQHVPLIQRSDIADLTVICLLPGYISRRIIESKFNPAAYAGKVMWQIISFVDISGGICSITMQHYASLYLKHVLLSPYDTALTFQLCAQLLVCYFKESTLSRFRDLSCPYLFYRK